MLAIPSDQSKLVRPAELFSYGVREVDPVLAESKSLQLAQLLKVSHQEIITRMARARTRCSTGLNPNPFVASAELVVSQCYSNIVYR